MCCIVFYCIVGERKKTAFEFREARYGGPSPYPIDITYRRSRVNYGVGIDDESFDGSTGKFTAPCDGLYSFYFYTLSAEQWQGYGYPDLLGIQPAPRPSTRHVFLVKNRTRFLDLFCSSKSRICSGRTVISLDKDDEVWAVLDGGKAIDKLSTRFSGYLVYDLGH